MISSNKRVFCFLLLPPCIYLNLYGFSNIGSMLSIGGLFFAYVYCLFYGKVICLKSDRIHVIVAIFIYICYVCYNNLLHGINIISGLFWWIYLLLALLLPIRLNKKDYIKIIKYYFYISTAVLIYDAYYRFFINVKDIPGIGRYAYKYGLIGIDSNFAGVYSLLCFCFFLFLFKKGKISVVYSLVYFLVTIATCSLAAISVSLFVIVFFLIDKTIYKIFVIFSLSFMSYFIVGFILTDGSGSSKFELINEAYHLYLSYDISDMFFGTGLGSVIFNVSQLPPHLLLLQLILEFGLVGLVLFFFIPVIIIIKWGKDYIYIFIPYFLVGFSVVTISNPILATLTLLYYYFKETEWEN